jgi:hypothetical protein
LEGFKLGVCPAPPEVSQIGSANAAGFAASTNVSKTTGSVFTRSACYQAVLKLILQKPQFAVAADANTAYTLACNYLTSIRKFLATGSFTNCQATDALNNESIPKPAQAPGYIAQVQTVVDDMVQKLFSLLLDCFCLSLLPTCPPDPCTNCLVLACVTVQNGEIIDICHFGGGRRQVLTFPALGYWLSLFGLDASLTTLTNFLEEVCCGKGEFTRLFQSSLAPAENFTAMNFASPALLNQTLSAALTQNLGATIVNAAAQGANTVDLRPLVGMDVNQVSTAMKANNIPATMVEASAAWTDSVAAQGQSVAPSAFPAGQSLTVFTRNKMVVGFQPTSPTDALKLQLADLQAQVNALQSQLGSSSPSSSQTGPKPPRKG